MTDLFKEKTIKNKSNLKLCRDLDRKCMMCGTIFNLDAHHIIFGSYKNDAMWNLITLCRCCHDKMHNGVVVRGVFQHGRLIMLKLLKHLVVFKCFRWGKALEILERKYGKDNI